MRAQGESSEEIKYGFIHNAPASGINYYRLTITDLDKTSTRSGIRSVVISSLMLNLYPNPVESGILTLDMGEEKGCSVKVYSVAGVADQ